VPLVPGYHGADQDPALLQREADRIGYPVLIKASAGGGGKGMRAVDKAEDFAAALASASARPSTALATMRCWSKIRAAPAPHRDPGVWRHARQLRVPVRARLLGAAPPPEGAGRSPRARHEPELRAQMGEAAVAAARAVNYVGAGTVEFIVEQPGGYEQVSPRGDELLTSWR
jgi:3-methylcrotonyl-CoA carboxylase alpha subunit